MEFKMSGRFSESFIDELIERNDIADVVGSYVNLSKRSGSNLFGLCPFHNEKTPSFSVSSERQTYHCFGCGKGGGVISFIMEIEGLSFPEAVEFLAKRAGMKIPERDDGREGRVRDRMYALNRDAAKFFYSQLSSPGGKAGVDYINKRQISPATVKNFGLGYAPDSWTALSDALISKGYSEEELISADLAKMGKNGRIYDSFRNRLMFPVIDVRGNVIGFSGRILGDGDPKYLNSRDTLVFTKGKNLFGLNLAKKSKAGYIILAEGNVDVVSLHQAGFDSAVASLGTSLTPDQARLISRYTNEVIIAYDSDGAGIKASQRAIDILGTLDVKVKVLRMDGAKDPDEYIKAKGAASFRNLIEGSESQIDFRLGEIRSRFDISIPEQKVDFLRESAKLVSGFSSSIERQVYSLRVAEMASVSADAVTAEVERMHKAALSKAKKESQRSAMRPELSAQPAARELRYENVGSAIAEEGVIRLVYLEPSLLSEVQIGREDFTSEALGKIFEALKSQLAVSSKADINALSEFLDPNEISLLLRIVESPENLANAKDTIKQYISRITEQKSEAVSAKDLINLAKSKRDKGKGYLQDE